MKTTTVLFGTLLALMCWGAESVSIAQPYNVQNIGSTLGGQSYAEDVNDNGKVVGYWISTNGARAFLWSSGIVTNLGNLGSTNDYALNINSSAQVVGFAETTNGIQAFLLSSASLTNLGPLGGINSYACDISDAGVIVGHIDTTNGARAFRWSEGGLTELGTLGGTNSYAFAVNNSGLIVGASLASSGHMHAFAWQNGVLTNLNDSVTANLGWVLEEARAVDSAGKIVGVGSSGAIRQGFILEDSQITSIGVLPGGTNSIANAVNTLGTVVGTSSTTNGELQAVLWKNGVLTNLNVLIPTNSGWNLQEATGVNESSQIVGWGTFNGQTRAFLLSTNVPPVVEITNLADEITIAGPLTLPIRISVQDDGDAVQKLEFFNGSVKIGEISPAVHSYDWVNAPLGSHSLKVVATDYWGATGTSSVVNVSILSAPVITSQPVNTRVPTGSNAVFSVSASGDGPLQYRWAKDGVSLASATNCTLTITNAQTIHDGYYSVTVSNAVGVALSASASLEVTVNPLNLGKGDWVYHLSDATNRLGGNVPSVTNLQSFLAYERQKGMEFLVVKSGEGGTFWDQFNTNLIAEAHSLGLKVFGYGRVYGTNLQGEIAVATNTLAIGADGFVIDAEIEYESHILANNSQIAEQYCQAIREAFPNAFLAHAPFVSISTHATFPYVTFGRYCDLVMPQCYWRSFGVSPSNMVVQLNTEWNAWHNSLTGADTNAIKPIAPIGQGWIPSHTNATSGQEIKVFVDCLKALPNPASPGGYKGVSFWRADLHSPDMWESIGANNIGNPSGIPLITVQPQSQTVTNGHTLSLLVEADGAQPMTFLWRLNGSVVPGATNNTLIVTNFQSSDAGVYSVLVSNIIGSTLSTDATVNLPSFSIWFEDFEAGLGNWSVISGATFLTNSGAQNHTANGTNSARVGSTSNKIYRNIGAELAGNSRISFWLYDSNQTRAYGEVRGYDGSGYGSGSVRQILAVGRYHVGFGTGTGDFATEVLDTTKYQGRVAFGSSAGWFNLNAPGAPSRSPGWHHFEIERLSDGTTLKFYVDGVLSRTVTGLTDVNWDSVTLGSVGAGSTAGDAWFDDVAIEALGVPQILAQPQDVVANATSNVTFTVSAVGHSPTYQWRFNGANIAGATTTSLSLTNVSGASAGIYTVVVQNLVGATVSRGANLIVIYPPTIVSAPQNVSVPEGSSAEFSVIAGGPGPFTYRWFKDGVLLANGTRVDGATSDRVTIISVNQADVGHYGVQVSNPAGTITSSTAVLSVIGNVVFRDTFEAGLGNWDLVPGASSLTVSTSFPNPVSGANTAHETNALNRMYHNLGTEVIGRARASFWIHNDSAELTRSFGEIRGYSGTGFGSGTLEQVIAIGHYTVPFDLGTGSLISESASPAVYQGRVLNGANSGWMNLVGGGAIPRSTGWHLFTIEKPADGGSVHFFVDGKHARTVSGVSTSTWDVVVIGGAGVGSGVVENALFDDVSVERLNPIIVSQPQSVTNLVGATASFTVAAVGDNLSYQWRKNGIAIAGATASTFTIGNLQVSSAGDYSVLVNTATDREYSALATLVVPVTPSITSHPTTETLCEGAIASFAVSAVGTGISYQWRKNGVALTNGNRISGANTRSLEVSSLRSEDAGAYSVQVSNLAGTIISSAAPLTVTPSALIDLDVDSDNNNWLGQPSRSTAEEALEDNTSKPGKYVIVSSGDFNTNGVPDFADGFNGAFGTQTNNAAAPFTPLILNVSTRSPENTQVVFSFSESDPSGITTSGTEGNYSYTPAPGKMRIWKKDGNTARNKASASQGGDLIRAQVQYSLSDLGLEAGSSAVTLYIEGVSISGSSAESIVVVTTNATSSFCTRSDAVRITIDGDSDKDGLANHWELAIGTSSLQPDSDMDGIKDGQEIIDGTNPLLESDVTPRRLVLFTFAAGTNHTCASSSGQPATGVSDEDYCPSGILFEATNSFDAFSIDMVIPRLSPPTNISLSYKVLNPSNDLNVSFRSGTVSLWFRPNWTSGTNIVPFSQAKHSLFSLSRRGSNETVELPGAGWSLEVGPTGTNLFFSTTKSNSNQTVTVTSGAVDWQMRERDEFPVWHNVVVSYSLTNVCLFSDGVLIASNATDALVGFPGTGDSLDAWRLWIGGILDESLANGSYDVIETFNHVLSAEQVLSKYKTVADRDTDADGLTDLDELRRGLNPWFFDSDGDGLPDGWEVAHDLDPRNSEDAVDDPDEDGRKNVEEFLYGTNPHERDAVLQSLPYDLVGYETNQEVLLNLDFGNRDKAAPVGVAAAGITNTDAWTVVPLFRMGVTVLTNAAGATNHGITLAKVYGPVIHNFTGFDAACFTNWCEETTDLLCSHSYSCTGIQGGTYHNLHQSLPDGVFSDLGLMLDAICAAAMRQHLMNVYALHESLARLSGSMYFRNSFNLASAMHPFSETVSEHAMFSDFAYTSDEENDFVNHDCGQFYGSGGNARLAIQGLKPGRKYRLYIYSSVGYDKTDGVSSGYPPYAARFHTLVVNPEINYITNTARTGWLPAEYYHSWPYHFDWDYEPLTVDDVRMQLSGGTVVRVPNAIAGSKLSSFVRDVNYASAGVSADEKGTIEIFWPGGGRGLLNGLQVVELFPPAAPSVTANALVGAGVMLKWEPIPGALEYDIVRGTTSNNLVKIASTRDFSYQDTDVIGAPGAYFYAVVAKNEVSDTSSAVHNVTVSAGSNPNVNYAPILNGINPLKYAYENSAFLIGASQIQQAADAHDVERAPLKFVITEVLSGKLELLKEGAQPQIMSNEGLQSGFGAPSVELRTIGNGTSLRWTSDKGASGDVAAFRVRAFDGMSLSRKSADVRITVKPQTVLYGWGNYSRGMSGRGIPNAKLESPVEWERVHEVTAIGNENDSGLTPTATIPWPDHTGYHSKPEILRPDGAQQHSASVPVWNGSIRNVSLIAPGSHASGFLSPRAARTVLTADGSVWTWGIGVYGQLGDGFQGVSESTQKPFYTVQQPVPRRLDTISNVVHLAANSYSTLAVKSDGTVWGWGVSAGAGSNSLFDGGVDFDELNVPLGSHWYWGNHVLGVSSPVKLEGLENIVQVAVWQYGYAGAALTADGRVYHWGDALDITLVAGLPYQPVEVYLPEPIVQIVAGGKFFLALSATGKVFVWGHASHGTNPQHHYIFGDGSTGHQATPKLIPFFSNGGAKQLSAGAWSCAALMSDGRVVQWGRFGEDNYPNHTRFTEPTIYKLFERPTFVRGLSNIANIEISSSACFAVDREGKLWAWGYNSNGTFGRANEGEYLVGSVQCPRCIPGVEYSYVFAPRYHADPVHVGALKDVDLAALNTDNALASAVANDTPYGLQARPSSQAVTLSWLTLPGISTYEVSRSETLNGTFLPVGFVSAAPDVERQEFQDSGLVNHQAYFYKVSVVVGSDKNTSTPVRVVPQDVPGKPSGLTAWSKSRQVELQWEASPDAEAYLIYRSNTDNSSAAKAIIAVDNQKRFPGTNVMIFNDAMLPTQQFYYWVSALNPAGESSLSSMVTATPHTNGPPAPSGLDAVAYTDSVLLKWDSVPATNGPASYVVRKARARCSSTNTLEPDQYLRWEVVGVFAGVPDSEQQTYHVARLGKGYCYAFSVSTIDSSGEGAPCEPKTARPNGIPQYTLLTKKGGPGSLYLKWNSEAESFRVRLIAGGQQQAICDGSPSSGKTIYPDDVGNAEFWMTGLDPGPYSVEISPLFGDDGFSVSPIIESGILVESAGVGEIREIKATVADRRVELSWWGSSEQDAASALQKYDGWRFLVLRYKVGDTYLSTDFPCSGYVMVGEGEGLTFTDDEVENGATYRYRVVAISPLYQVYQRDLGTTSAPTGIVPVNVFDGASLSITSATALNGAVHLIWSGNNLPGGATVQLFARTGDQTTFSIIADVTGSPEFVHDRVLNGTTYHYKVRAWYANGDLLESAVVSATPLSTNPLPAPNTFAGGISGNRLQVRWRAVEGAANYKVRKWDASSGAYTNFLTTTRADFDDALLGPTPQNAVYRYEVRAISAGVVGQVAEIRVAPLTWAWPPSPAPSRPAIRFEIHRQCAQPIWVKAGETAELRFVDVQTQCVATGASYRVVPVFDNSDNEESYGNPVNWDEINNSSPGLDLPPNVVAWSTAITNVELLDFSRSEADPTRISTPTNLTVRVSVAVVPPDSRPDLGVQYVELWGNGSYIGKATSMPYDFNWVNPGGSLTGKLYKLVARVVDTDGKAANSTNFYAKVEVVPQLKSYATSVTDLQLSAPGVPVAFTRTYDSTETESGILGRGWSTVFDRAHIIVPADLDAHWEMRRAAFTSQRPYDIQETKSHRIEVTLPSGQKEAFQLSPSIWEQNSRQAVGGVSFGWLLNDAADYDFKMPFVYTPTVLGAGELTETNSTELRINGRGLVDDLELEFYGSDKVSITLKRADNSAFAPEHFRYITADGTIYEFGDPISVTIDDRPSKRLRLLSVGDRNGNKVTYSKAVQSGSTAWTAAHSNGRSIQLVQQSFSTYTNYNLFDAVSPFPGGTAVTTFRFENGSLTEAAKLKSRTGSPAYETTKYTYVTGAAHAKANGLLKEIISPEGVVLLQNDYFGTLSGDVPQFEKFVGFLRSQKDAVGVEANLHHESGENSGDNLSSSLTQSVPGESGANSTGQLTYNSSGELVSAVNEANETSSFGYDGNGNLAYSQDAAGNLKTYGYDSENRPNRVTDELGNTTHVMYGPNDQPLETTDAKGRKTRYEYYTYPSPPAAGSDNPEGSLRALTDPSGLRTEYTYNSRGQVLTETRTYPGLSPETTTYEYYGASDAGGGLGDLKSVKQPMSGSTPELFSTVYTYDANGNKATEKKFRTVIQRDGNGVPVANDVLETTTTHFHYDAQNRLVTNTITVQVGGGTDAPLQTSSTEYNEAGKTSVSTDAYGRKTYMTYDVRGNLVQTLHPGGHVTRSVYDGKGRLLWQQERAEVNGALSTAPATRHEYDAAGRSIKVKKFESVTFELTNATAKAIGETISDAKTEFYRTNSAVDQFIMKVVSEPASNTFVTISRTSYDSAGRVKYTMDARGTVTENVYDAAGRRKETKVYPGAVAENELDSGETIPTPGGTPLVTKYTYDENGNQTSVIDANNNETRFEYDSADRRVKTWFPFVGNATARTSQVTTYDGFGRRIRETDEAGVVTAFGYDALGRLTSVTNDWRANPPGGMQAMVTRYEYDELGNMVAQIDAKGNTTRYEYDALGQRTHRFLPGATLVDSDQNPYLERVFYHKDEIGSSGVFTQRREVRDFRGKTITQRFDLQERLTEKVLPPINNNETGTTNTFFYNDSLAGQLEKVVSGGDVNRTNFYAYDAQRRLKRKDTPEGVVAYNYRNDGLLSTIKGYRRGAVAVNADPTAATPDVNVAYGYDQLGRLHSVTNNALNTNNVTIYQYDTVGNLEKVIYPNSVEHRYSYTDQNRLKHLAVTNTANTVLLRSYTYDLSPTGQRTGVTESNTVGGVVGQRWRVVYEYDQDYNTPATLLSRVNRLTRESLFDRTNAVAGTITHAYDLVGNRVNRGVSLAFTPEESYGNQSLNFDERDWIDGNNDPSDANSNYDRNGNIVVDETDTATGDLYDAENLLIQRGSSITIGYDDEGHRTSKTVGGTTTIYLVDDRNPTGYVQVIAEYGDTSAAPLRSYVYGNDLISQTLNSGTYYYCYDGHGSVRVVVGAEGTELNSYDYDAYGKLLAKTEVVENWYRYTGEQWDADVGMYFLRARYYRPEVGRFWTMDSYEGAPDDPQTLHKYLYCHANPVNGVDYSGREFSLGGMLSTVANISRIAVQVTIRGLNFYDRVETAVDLYGLAQQLYLVYEGEADGTMVAMEVAQELLSRYATAKVLGFAGTLASKSGKRISRSALNAWVKQHIKDWAGHVTKRGVVFKPNGFPDLKPYLKTDLKPGQRNTVKIKLTGKRVDDYRAANKEAGFGDTAKPPKGYTWHHHERLGVMELVETRAHQSCAPSPGGVKLWELLTGDRYQ